MTPKEKAEELCLKYHKIIERTLSIEHVKLTIQCALIAVDEMIELCDSYVAPYYYEVKKELEEMR